MNSVELTDCLVRASEGENFLFEVESIFEDFTLESDSLEIVRAILKFMEQRPGIDYGTPGPLVHFVERFYGQGYEAELEASISRQPTSHTVWMINRLINGTKQPSERERLLNILRKAGEHPTSDAETKNLIQQFMDLQASE